MLAACLKILEQLLNALMLGARLITKTPEENRKEMADEIDENIEESKRTGRPHPLD